MVFTGSFFGALVVVNTEMVVVTISDSVEGSCVLVSSAVMLVDKTVVRLLLLLIPSSEMISVEVPIIVGLGFT